MLRLFETGNVEEGRIILDLRRIGCTVWDQDPATDKQFRYVALSGHLSGGLDGVVTGLPEAPRTAHLLECKTHNARSFKDLTKLGVGGAKPGHLAQMQVLCKLADLSRWCYIAVNKDTDEIYMERGEFDPQLAERWMSRAHEAIFSPEPPERVSDSPDWHECARCPFKALCHGTDAPRPNCRTCAHATPVDDGAWECARWQQIIPQDAQRIGCEQHRYIPALMASFAELESHDEDTDYTVWRNKLTGGTFDQPRYSSLEIYQAADKRVLGDAGVNEIKDAFSGDARIGWDDFQSDTPWLEKDTARGNKAA
jgi:hypothetical protein